jgi:ABC-type uncharacterized transport system substrate-binding protein
MSMDPHAIRSCDRSRRAGAATLLAACLAACLPAASWAAAAPTTARVPGTPLKILHVMSYHAPWRWTDGQLQGFKEGLDAPAEYRVIQLDAKRNGPGVAARAAEAQQLIKTWKPDLLYTSDDDVQEHLAKHHVGSALPLVFSGVNKDPATYGFAGSPNVTGVIEQEHFVESVRLLRALVPSARRFVAVFDDSPMWAPVQARMKAKLAQLPGVEFVAWDTIRTFKEFQERMRAYPATADAVALIGIFNFKDEAGRNVPYQDVLRWTAENSTLPDFGYWVDRVHFGTLAAVTVSEREQGLAAGRQARAILLDGKSPSALPMVPTLKGAPVISLARAKKLGINVKTGLLLSAEVVQRYEWEQ